MRYLAEVQKQARFLGSSETQLKLLACQRWEQKWSVVPSKQLIPAPEASHFNTGVLVFVQLSPEKEVQSIEQATISLVNILQNLSGQLEKAKQQEEEIHEWKQSLTYSQREMDRREMELEARIEQLQLLEEDFEQLEQKRQEIQQALQEIEQQRQQLELERKQLNSVWNSKLETQRQPRADDAVLGGQQF